MKTPLFIALTFCAVGAMLFGYHYYYVNLSIETRLSISYVISHIILYIIIAGLIYVALGSLLELVYTLLDCYTDKFESSENVGGHSIIAQ